MRRRWVSVVGDGRGARVTTFGKEKYDRGNGSYVSWGIGGIF